VKAELVTSSGEYPSLALNRDGTLVAGGGAKQHLKLWETATGKLRTELPGPHEAWVMGTSFSPDGDWLVSADGDPRDHSRPCHLKLWDVKRGREVAHYDLPRGCFYNASSSPPTAARATPPCTTAPYASTACRSLRRINPARIRRSLVDDKWCHRMPFGAIWCHLVLFDATAVPVKT
jgi:hypothetical protein